MLNKNMIFVDVVSFFFIPVLLGMLLSSVAMFDGGSLHGFGILLIIHALFVFILNSHLFIIQTARKRHALFLVLSFLVISSVVLDTVLPYFR